MKSDKLMISYESLNSSLN